MRRIFWNTEENRLRSFWRLLLFLLLVAAMALVISFTVQLIGAITGIFGGNQPLIWVTNGLIMLVAILGATALTGRRLDRRSFANFGFHFNRRWWADLVFGLLLGAGLMLLVFLIEKAFGWLAIDSVQSNQAPRWSFAAWIVSSALFYLCVGIYEEVFTRGYLLRNLAEGLRFGRVQPKTALLLAYLLSSSIFGILHLANQNSTLVSTLNLMLAGLFLGLGYVLTGELAISIGLHITWNFFQGPLFGFPVSGSEPTASLIGIRQLGPEWLTGGAFGPEAGALGLAVMLLGSVLIIFWVRRMQGTPALRHQLAEYQPSQAVQAFTSEMTSVIGAINDQAD